MKAKTTKTLNPLPFGDLEPRRFEDLVRQLAYDLRPWKSLEATGRSGSDDGIDIRAIEAFGIKDVSEEGEETEPSGASIADEKLWIFQCKREKSFSPAKVSAAVESSLSSLAKPPHAFILAVASDVSKQARDVFRSEMVKRQIEEYAIWAKGELEDMLFQPKNDHLLFAYFGLSLQPRRRSLATSLRSKISIKKQLMSVIDETEEDDGHSDQLILLRDPADDRYPHEPKSEEPPPRWLVCKALTAKHTDSLYVLRSEYYAAVTSDHTGWDAAMDYDAGSERFRSELDSKKRFFGARPEKHDSPHSFWYEFIPESERAMLEKYRKVNFDRVLAIDPIGDVSFPIPHIFIEFNSENGPFEPYLGLRIVTRSGFGQKDYMSPEEENKVTIFPEKYEKGVIPKRFDQLSTGKIKLTSDAESEFQKQFDVLKNQKSLVEAKRSKPVPTATLNPRYTAFRKWREEIAFPLFTSVVRVFRKAGHECRIVARPENVDAADDHGQEYIELKIGLDIGGTSGNPDYKPQGSFKIICHHHGLEVIMSPQLEDSSRNSRGGQPQPKLEELTVGYLESQVLKLVNRIKEDSSRYVI